MCVSQISMCYSHSLRAIASVVHGGRYGHDKSRDAVARQVEVALAGMFALKDLHQHDVELHAFQEHPRERRQEEEMQQSGKHGADDLHKTRRKGSERN